MAQSVKVFWIRRQIAWTLDAADQIACDLERRAARSSRIRARKKRLQGLTDDFRFRVFASSGRAAQ
jgi:hypothetical protein